MRKNQRRAAKVGNYHSRFEAEIGATLERLGIPFEYELHSFLWHEKVPNTYCSECGNKKCIADRTYTPDFFLIEQDIVIEAKGIFTPKDRKIAQAMKLEYPDTDMRYLFYFDNALKRGSKTRYTDWCAKQKLPCGVRKSMEKTLKEWTS